MSQILQFENQIETAAANFFIEQGIEATSARFLDELGTDSVQVVFDYNGSLEDTRQQRAGYIEYDGHTGTLMILVSTFRNSPTKHNERLGKIRALMLNGNHGLQAENYKFLDLNPTGTTSNENEETNQDISTLQYEIKFTIDLNAI